MRNGITFLAGLVFGLGLIISGMINPQKIIGFLNVTGAWDPTLLTVMAGALITTFVGYRTVLRREKPLLETAFRLPQKTEIDRPLMVGAAIFGVGWGLSGLCPGPGISAILIGGVPIWAFVGSMLAGMGAVTMLKR